MSNAGYFSLRRPRRSRATYRKSSRLLLVLALVVVAGCSSSSSDGTSPADAGSAGEEAAPDARAIDAALDGRSVKPFEPIRIACGQTKSVIDADGQVWNADKDYSGGSAMVGSGTIAGTTSAAVYQGQRYGDHSTAFHYTFAVAPGEYSVVLKFDEGYFKTGGRVFDVSINGRVVLPSFDIYVAAGNALDTAVDEKFSIKVAKEGALTIDFDPVVQDPKIDAILVTQGNPDAGTGTDAADRGGSNADKLRSYLANLNKGSTRRVLSGQHVQIWNGDSVSAAMSDVTPLASETGQSPAILGVVMNYVGNSGAYDIGVANMIANQWWAQGGLIELSIYSDDPTFSFNSNGYPTTTNVPASAFHQLTDTTSAAYAQWHSQLDTYAAELHTLTDSGNVVLLRPFIELNGGWNWYGAQNPTDFIFVWKDMYDYLMKTKGLVDVLWIYNVNANVGQYSDYYPGSSYVDIVGMDIYDSPDNYVVDANDGGMYAFLSSTGKPLILPEVGLSSASPGTDSIDNSQLISIIQTSLPNVVGFVDWCGAFALTNQNGASALLNNSWVVNLSELPKGI